AERPGDGTWEVPPILARHPIPEEWRFLLVIPDIDPGKSGTEEDEDMRAVVERASPGIADEITAITLRNVLPAIVEEDLAAFGSGVAAIGRLNGAWYADAQGGVYRPPVGEVVRELESEPAIEGAGQSSWGPVVYGVTDRERAEAAREAGRRALSRAGVEGAVYVVAGRNEGARID
ncbi:MAG: GHMP kinase, partial [Halalkalicoccus sp.]|nr:GHMP kinase [Halalkalicoccus sp.]